MQAILTHRHGPQGLVRRALVGGLFVTAIIVGLLGMHALGLHGTTAAASGEILSAAHHASAVEHTSLGDHAVAPSGIDGGCPSTECITDNHAHLAVSCVVALLLGLLIMAPPRVFPRVRQIRRRMASTVWTFERVQLRAPGLQVLCISRT